MPIKSKTLADWYVQEKDFKFDLDRALVRANPKSETELPFLNKIKAQHSQFGMKAFMSEAQYEWIVDLANRSTKFAQR